MKLNERSLRSLKGVHPDMVRVVRGAAELTDVDFIVTEGLRTAARQKQLVAAGASKTMRSRHLTGHAVDLAAIVGGKVRWDWPLYQKLAKAMKQAAKQARVPIEWGGDWKSFKDGPHFQLPWASHPIGAKAKPAAPVGLIGEPGDVEDDVELKEAKPEPKPLIKSKIAQAAAGAGVLGGTEVLSTANETAGQVAQLKNTADDLGLMDIVMRVASSPRFWIGVAIVVAAGLVCYFRWRDYGRGKVSA